VSIVAAAADAPGVILGPWPPRDGSLICREGFDRIPLGMSKEEVEKLLGPPGFEWEKFKDPDAALGLWMSLSNGPGALRLQHWIDPGGHICVDYDADNRVYIKCFWVVPANMKLNDREVLVARELRPFP
jgi:hypothetical protein